MAMARKNFGTLGHKSMQIDGGGPAVLGLGTPRFGHLSDRAESASLKAFHGNCLV